MPPQIMATITVPGERIGLVIGPKGATRRAIELEHGVDVTITTSPVAGAAGEVLVRGATQAQVDAALSMVRGYAKEQMRSAGSTGAVGMAGRATGTTVIPDLARGAVIGKGGAAIRILQAVTGCRIQIGEPEHMHGTTTISIEGPELASVDQAIVRVQNVVAAERLRIELRDKKGGEIQLPHVRRVVAVPPGTNIGAVCGREWSYLGQVQLQAGCFIRMDRGPEGGAGQQNQVSGVNLEIYAPTAESADKAECAIAKLIEQAARVPAVVAPTLSSVAFAPHTRSGAARQIVPTYALPSAAPSASISASAPPSLLSLIDGAWAGAASGRQRAVRSPAEPETVLALVPDMGAADTKRAIAAAHAAFPAWAARSPFERAVILRRMFERLSRHAEDVGALLSLEAGKPLAEAIGEVRYGADFLEWYAEEGKRSYGQVLPPQRADRRLLVLQQPVGPCALLTPWNFPLAMPARKVAPALAAGCTVVLRPSADTPLSALALARVADEAGLPAGVLNVVIGDDHAATAGVLCAAPEVRKLSFTGSTAVGKLLAAACAPTLKRLSLELGGRAPFVVFADADLEAAVEGAVAAKFRNAGQTCVCANAFFVHTSLHDAFVARFAARVAALRVGDGMVPGTVIGPLVSDRALRSCEALVADAVAKGAVVAAGGVRDVAAAGGGGGYFYHPTVLTNCEPSMRCVSEESFAPIAPVVAFSSDAEALALANASSVGLAAYFYTADARRAWRFAEALQVGMVGVNTGLISSASAPFGGVKESGYGREGAAHGLNEYLQSKYVMHAI